MFGLTGDEKAELRSHRLEIDKIYGELKRLSARCASMSRRLSRATESIEDLGGNYEEEEEEEEEEATGALPLDSFVKGKK